MELPADGLRGEDRKFAIAGHAEKTKAKDVAALRLGR
jgi:hypothetical protein